MNTVFSRFRLALVFGLAAPLIFFAGCDSTGSNGTEEGGTSNDPPSPAINVQTNTPVEVGAQVQVDGSESSDPDGDELSYDWSLSLEETDKTDLLSDSTAVDPTFAPDEAGDYTVTLVVSDGGATVTDSTTVTAESSTSAPSRPIAFARDGDIYVARTDGSVEAITSSSETAKWPSWSPDGTQIAFQRDDDILVVQSDGSNPENLTSDFEGSFRQPAWSPDGDRIALRRVGSGFAEGVYTIKKDGSDLQAVITEFFSAPAWSPDGNRISVQDGNDGVRTVKPDGSDEKQINSFGLSSTWSPDGSTIAFGTRGGSIDVIASDGSGSSKEVTDGFRPDWRPHSRIVFQSDRDDDNDFEDSNIYTIKPDGTEEKQITKGDAEDVNPNWKPES